MTVPNFMSKAFSFQGLRSGWTLRTPRGMIRQKYPGVNTVKAIRKNIDSSEKEY